jgi:putative endonuclease
VSRKAEHGAERAVPSPPASAPEPQVPPPASWFLYLIECADGSIYTGIARDVAARYRAHASGKGARYTRAHPPARVLATVAYPDRSSALKAEYRVKQLKAAEKRTFIARLSAAATTVDPQADDPGS